MLVETLTLQWLQRRVVTSRVSRSRSIFGGFHSYCCQCALRFQRLGCRRRRWNLRASESLSSLLIRVLLICESVRILLSEVCFRAVRKISRSHAAAVSYTDCRKSRSLLARNPIRCIRASIRFRDARLRSSHSRIRSGLVFCDLDRITGWIRWRWARWNLLLRLPHCHWKSSIGGLRWVNLLLAPYDTHRGDHDYPSGNECPPKHRPPEQASGGRLNRQFDRFRLWQSKSDDLSTVAAAREVFKNRSALEFRQCSLGESRQRVGIRVVRGSAPHPEPLTDDFRYVWHFYFFGNCFLIYRLQLDRPMTPDPALRGTYGSIPRTIRVAVLAPGFVEYPPEDRGRRHRVPPRPGAATCRGVPARRGSASAAISSFCRGDG